MQIAQPSIDIIVQRKQFLPFGARVYCHQYNISRGQKLQDRAFEARIVSYTGIYGIYKVADRKGNIIAAKNPVPRVPTPSPFITISASVQTEPSVSPSTPPVTEHANGSPNYGLLPKNRSIGVHQRDPQRSTKRDSQRSTREHPLRSAGSTSTYVADPIIYINIEGSTE